MVSFSPRFEKSLKKKKFKPFLHDALAFSAMEENFVTFSQRTVKVLSDGRFMDSPEGNEVMISDEKVDFDRFLEYILTHLRNIACIKPQSMT